MKSHTTGGPHGIIKIYLYILYIIFEYTNHNPLCIIGRVDFQWPVNFFFLFEQKTTTNKCLPRLLFVHLINYIIRTCDLFSGNRLSHFKTRFYFIKSNKEQKLVYSPINGLLLVIKSLKDLFDSYLLNIFSTMYSIMGRW